MRFARLFILITLSFANLARADGLFESDETLDMKITAEFSTPGASSSLNGIEGRIYTEGHSRSGCEVPPFRFEAKDNKKFQSYRALHFSTHCQDDANVDEGVIREYLIYKLYSILTPLSMRVRLLKVIYSNPSKTWSTTHYAFLIEDFGEVAARNQKTINKHEGVRIDPANLALVKAFEFFVQNGDWIYDTEFHNLVSFKGGKSYFLAPYDFDISYFLYGAPTHEVTFLDYEINPETSPIEELKNLSGKSKVTRHTLQALGILKGHESAFLAEIDRMAPLLNVEYIKQIRDYTVSFMGAIQAQAE